MFTPPKLALLYLLAAWPACAAQAAAAPEPTPGWVVDQRNGTPPAIVPAAEALAWRYDNDDGGQTTDIWIAAKPLTAEQRSALLPARSGQAYDEARQPKALGLAGLLIRVDDSGNGSRQMTDFCLPADADVECSGGSGLGMVLLRKFDAKTIAGEFYSRGADGTLHIARFDAPLKDEASTPLPDGVLWSRDGAEAGAAWLADNKAAQQGDVSVLKQHAMPERAADYDDPATVAFAGKIALKNPQILSARVSADEAFLWVRDQTGGAVAPGVQRVSMQRVNGSWRVAGVQMN